MLTAEQKRAIERACYSYYRKQNSTHSVWHMRNTVKLALYIAKKEKANTEICRYGAMLHQFHRAADADKLLRNLKVDDKTRKKLTHVVYCSRGATVDRAKTKEAKIVFDADKLQVLGAVGITRQIYDFAKYKHPKSNVQGILKKAAREQRYFYRKLRTKTAKKLARRHYQLSQRFFHDTRVML